MEGVKLATEQWWQDVLIESDAELVIKHINGASFLWKLDTIVENIKVLATPIESISWAHIPRAANQCANWLAKHAMQGMCTSDWVERPSTPLFSLLSSDCILPNSDCNLNSNFDRYLS